MYKWGCTLHCPRGPRTRNPCALNRESHSPNASIWNVEPSDEVPAVTSIRYLYFYRNPIGMFDFSQGIHFSSSASDSPDSELYTNAARKVAKKAAERSSSRGLDFHVHRLRTGQLVITFRQVNLHSSFREKLTVFAQTDATSRVLHPGPCKRRVEIVTSVEEHRPRLKLAGKVLECLLAVRIRRCVRPDRSSKAVRGVVHKLQRFFVRGDLEGASASGRSVDRNKWRANFHDANARTECLFLGASQ